MLRFRFSQPQDNKTEAGYLLASSAVLILVIVAMVASFAFVMNRGSRFQGNYAIGERLAKLAVMSHYYAQTQFYANGVGIDAADLYPLMPLPDNFNFSSPVASTNFTVEARGASTAPLGATSLQAASAYILLRIRPLNGKGRAPSDDVALESGANHAGLTRMGFYKIGIVPGDLCGGAAATVRWGPEDTACLSDSQIAALGFVGVQQGDIIFPAWETALATMNKDAVLRYPQPERSPSIMETDLNMQDPLTGKNQVKDLATINSSTMNATQTPTGSATFGGTLLVNPPAGVTPVLASSLNGPDPVAVKSTMNVYDSTGTLPQAMIVTGPVNFTGGNVMVGQTLTGGTGALNVKSGTDVAVQSISNNVTEMEIAPIDKTVAPLSVGVRQIVATPGNSGLGTLRLRGDSSTLAIASNLNAQNALLKNFGARLDIYSAEVDTPLTGNTDINNGGNPVAWSIQSIHQTGSDATHYLKADEFILGGCYSEANPNACPPPYDDTAPPEPL